MMKTPKFSLQPPFIRNWQTFTGQARAKLSRMNYKLAASGTLLVLAGWLPTSQAGVDLGSSADFAVLGGAAVTSSGNTVVNGSLGVSPGTAITGFGPGTVNGAIYSSGPVAGQAVSDARTAFSGIFKQASAQNLSGTDIGGRTFFSGVRNYDAAAQLTGTVTLDAQGNANAIFVFQIGTALTTASAAKVELINGAVAANIFWEVGSSATLGTGTDFYGTILADQSITLNTGTSLMGHAFALNGAVTLNDSFVSISAVPEANTALAGAFCVLVAGLGRGLAKRQKSAKKSA